MAAIPKSKEVRTYLFDSDKWTPGKAREWLKKKKKKSPTTVYRGDFLSYKQEPPFKYKAGSSRQLTLSKTRGIDAIVATPKKVEKPKAEKKKKPSAEKKKTRQPTAIKKGGKKKMATKALAKKEVKKRRKKNTSLIGGINFGSAFKDLIPLFCGAIICKFTAKKFVDGGGDREDWDWKNYALGLAGTVVAAFLSNAVFRGRGKVATLIFKGGLLLFFYKLFVNELVPKSDWLVSWFGQNEDIYPDMSEDTDIDEGDVYQGPGGQDVVYDDAGRYRPVDDMHRQPAVAQMGVVIEPADPNFGYEVVPADPNFGAAPNLNQRYAAAHGAGGLY